MKMAYAPTSVMKKWIRPQAFVHHAAEHLGEPVVGRGKHAEDRGHTHDQVEVANHKGGVMQRNVEHRLRQERTAESAGNEQGNESDGEQHGRLKTDRAHHESCPAS